MNYYFIDFENVHSDGFCGIEKVKKGDVIYVIYSERSKAFSLEILEKAAIQGAELKAYKVEVGSKNALDFQLSSFLGYIIGKSDHMDCSYTIVSKDMGYDKVVSFWKNRGRKIQRMINLSGADMLHLPALSPMIPKQETKPQEMPSNDGTQSVEVTQRKGTEQVQKTEIRSEQKLEIAPEAKPTQPLEAKKEQTEKRNSVANPKKRAIKPTIAQEHIEEKNTKKKSITKATEEEVRRLLSQEEYSDQILEIINKFKTKQAISNGLSKELRDSKKVGSIYKKLKPLLKEKKKT